MKQPSSIEKRYGGAAVSSATDAMLQALCHAPSVPRRFVHVMTCIGWYCAFVCTASVPMVCGLIAYIPLGYVPLRWVNHSVSSNFSQIYSWFLGVNWRDYVKGIG